MGALANGWMDEKLTTDWVKTVWGQRPGALSNKSLLILDAFRCHKSNKIKKLMKDRQTTLTIIPGRMTTVYSSHSISGLTVLLKHYFNGNGTTGCLKENTVTTPSGLHRK